MKKTLLIFNGFPRAGKDTSMDMLMEELLLWNRISHKHSTIDTIKGVALDLGWDGEKTKEMRCFLSEMKDLWTKYLDGPLEEIKELVTSKKCDYFLVAMREPEEIKKTVAWAESAKIRTRTIIVKSQNREERDHGSHSDLQINNYKYDYIIHNEGNFDILKDSVRMLASILEK